MAAAVVNIAELATQFDEEVEYIWTCVLSLQIQFPLLTAASCDSQFRNISPLKVMYIFARYYPFLLY